MMPRLWQPLHTGPLDIIGDVHGEFDALCQLVQYLGYDRRGRHPQQRRLVFVGDLCDRGPDSAAVMNWVLPLVGTGQAQMVLGNHEVNLLRSTVGEDNTWFFNAPDADRKRWVTALDRLPLWLERPDLRVVHAAWHEPSVNHLREWELSAPNRGAIWHFQAMRTLSQRSLRESGLTERYAAEQAKWASALRDKDQPPPWLPATAAWEAQRQASHPMRVLTAGLDQPGTAPYYSGGHWRFVERQAWWMHYTDPTPVVIGHYWRSPHAGREVLRARPGSASLFGGVAPWHWHGALRQVFCVDFSVGARYKERKRGQAPGSIGSLAALRWPERVLMTDDGQVRSTE